MRWNKIMVMFRKDYDDILRSKYVASSLILMPLLMIIIIPLVLFLPLVLDPTSFDIEEFAFLTQFNFTDNWQTLTDIQQVFVVMVEFSNIFFLLIPMILPTIIAADSFSGEKDRGTVEGLVAAPLTNAELYLGKVFTAVVPVVLIIWVFSLPQMVMINYFSNLVLGTYYLPNLRYLLLVIFYIPLLAILMTNAMIWASSRTNTTRDAQQLGSLIALPLMILILNFSSLAIIVSEVIIMIGIVVLGILAYLSYSIGIKLLDRERWLSYAN